jgi:hypothetical protein
LKGITCLLAWSLLDWSRGEFQARLVQREEKIMKQLAGLMLTLAALPTWAGTVPVPEPGVLPLLAIGAVGGIVLWVRNRNKKK